MHMIQDLFQRPIIIEVGSAMVAAVPHSRFRIVVLVLANDRRVGVTKDGDTKWLRAV